MPVEEQIARTPAQSPADVGMQRQVALASLDGFAADDPAVRIIVSAAAELERLTARPA